MANKVSPIKPDEIGSAKATIFPDEVFESFNELIASNFTGGSVTIKQDDAVMLMVQKGLAHEDIFAKGWLNIEEAYRSAGWDVYYDKPGYNETYPAIFKFSSKKA